MPGKKILMLTGEFTEEYEIFVFQQGMEAVGHTVHVICPDKKKGDMIQTSLHDFEGHQTYIERYGHFADINKTFSEAEKQLDFFENSNPRHQPLMKAIDNLNRQFGRQTIKLASQDIRRKSNTNQKMISLKYSTRLNEIIKINV